MVCSNTFLLSSLFDEIISALLDPFEPRKRDKVFKKAELIHNMVFEDKVDISVMLVELLFVSYSFVQSSTGFINTSTFLLPKTSEIFPRFTELFKTAIVDKANLHSAYYPGSGNISRHYVKCTNNNYTSAQLLYYISCHDKFIIEFSLDGDYRDIFYQNREKIKKFYKLIKIIK